MLDLLLPPDAYTVLLPESNNCCTDTPVIPIIIVLISLQPIKEELLKDRQDSVLICLRNRPTDKQALYLTTITTQHLYRLLLFLQIC